MNYRKRKQQENYNKTWFLKKEQYNPYSRDPEEAKCPYCGLSGKPCSHINGLSRAWARGAREKILAIGRECMLRYDESSKN